MRIAVACDHAGFPLKALVIETIRSNGHEALDLGTDSEAPVDYPDFALRLGRLILAGQAERGILLCGSGVGASIAANKIKGIYAGVCHDTYSAHQAVEHDHMNVLCLGPRIVGPELVKELVANFVRAIHSTEERHIRRIAKMQKIEQELKP